MRVISGKIIILILVAAAIAFWLFSNWKGKGKEVVNKPAPVVSVEKAVKKDMPLELRAVGSVTPYQTVAIRSRIDSQVMEVKFSDGDYVEKGQLLFILDDRVLKAQLAEQQANLLKDKAQVNSLLRQYERVKQLSGKGFESAAKLDDVKAAYEAQLAMVNATAAAGDNIKVQLQYTKIISPISGRTGTINVTVGNNVKANDPQALVTINQIKPIRVQAAIPERYFDLVKDYSKFGIIEVSAEREGNKKIKSGILEYIDNNIDKSTGTFSAGVSFDNEDQALWPGMFVNLLFQLGMDKGRIVVPEVAIQRGQEGDYIFILNAEKANKKSVKIDRMQDGFAVISEGIAENDIVITDGIMSLSDGSNVKVTGSGQQAK